MDIDWVMFLVSAIGATGGSGISGAVVYDILRHKLQEAAGGRAKLEERLTKLEEDRITKLEKRVEKCNPEALDGRLNRLEKALDKLENLVTKHVEESSELAIGTRLERLEGDMYKVLNKLDVLSDKVAVALDRQERSNK